MTRRPVRSLGLALAVVDRHRWRARPCPACRPRRPSSTPAPSAASGGTDCPKAQPAALPAGETRTVTISTELGSMTLKIEADLSPIAAGNFVALAGCGYYDGVVFHRVVPRVRDPGRGSHGPRGRRAWLHDQGRAGHRPVRAGRRGDGPHAGARLGRIAVLHRARRRSARVRSPRPTPTRSSATSRPGWRRQTRSPAPPTPSCPATRSP